MIEFKPAPPSRIVKRSPHEMFKDWTQEEIVNIVEEYKNRGGSITGIAKKMDCTYSLVRKLLIEQGVLRRKVGDFALSDDQRKDVIDLYLAGWGVSPIAKKFECSYDTIKFYIVSNGIALRGYHRVRFTEKEKNDIVERYKNGEGITLLARSFEISITPILRILDENGISRRDMKARKTLRSSKTINRIVPLAVFSNRRNGALRNGISWEISIDDVETLFKNQDGKCFYTGVKMNATPDQDNYNIFACNNPLSISIDRRDSGMGYTHDNVVLCCRFINYAKNAYSENRFKAALTQVVQSLAPQMVKSEYELWNMQTDLKQEPVLV